MSTIKAANLQNTGSGAPTFKNSSGTEIGQLAKAWVNFNGTGTVAIRDDFNVSSITDNGTGDYTVTLSTAMANTNYAAFAHTSRNPVASGTGDRLALIDMSLSSASAVRCKCTNSDAAANSSFVDCEFVAVAVFGA